MAAREPERGAGSGGGATSGPSGATVLLAGAVSYALVSCAGVTPEEMSLPTPCSQWDLGTLLGHLSDSMADLEAAIRTGYLNLEVRNPDPIPGDPVEVLRDRAAHLLYTCYEGCGHDRFVLVGGLPLAAGIIACTGAVEVAVHAWDVSAACGRGDPIPPRLAVRMLTLCPLLVVGREGLFAEPVEVSPEASPCDRLVGYLGRVPRPRQIPEHPSAT
jgi:uncharacterized protein (TIGR03086 family)